MSLVEVSGVTKTYRRGGLFGRGAAVRAVDNVSLALAAGACTALVGASGSGKSTLGRLVLGLEAPDAGAVAWKGRPLSRLRGRERLAARRSIQAVFQNSRYAVNPRLTAGAIVAEPLVNFDALRGDRLKGRVAELLEEVGLAAADMNKLPHQFSGGELQRVCLARALAPEPELLVLDEAVSSLDLLTQARVLDLLGTIRRQRGTAFLFITHDMRLVAAIADRLAVMAEGRLACLIPNLDAALGAGTETSREYRDLVAAVLPALEGSSRKECNANNE